MPAVDVLGYSHRHCLRRTLLCLLTSGLFVVGFSEPLEADPKPERLVIATWNLEWFFDENQSDNRSDLAKQQSAPSRTAWEWKRDSVAQVIAEIKPDLIALQEIENRKVLEHLCRQLDKAHKLKYRIAFIEGRDTYTEQDVAILYRSGLVSYSRHEQTSEMFTSKEYYNLSKHLSAQFTWGQGKDAEHLAIMNVHFRASARSANLRRRQARLAHTWIEPWLRSGKHVIVTGDFNSDQPAGDSDPTRTIALVCGRASTDPDDDLFDLHTQLAPDARRTHLIPQKQFDRILISRSLAASDSPSKGKLTFHSIQTFPELVTQGEADPVSGHWEKYYEIPASERDISDHYPVVATFKLSQ